MNIEEMKKIDLHAHLNGTVSTQVFMELCSEFNIEIPTGFDLNRDLQVLKKVDSLIEYFRPWDVFKKLPIGYECLTVMVKSAFENLKKDNVSYIEFRNSPFYISKINGISLEEALVWLIESIKEQSETYDINARLILSLTRHELLGVDFNKLLEAIRKVNIDNVIVGVDMSGNEDIKLPYELEKFFLIAKEDLGLGITIHAGETGNYKNIEWAIKNCGAMRIGHGSAAVKSENLLNLILEKDICLEVCLISNLRTGYVQSIEDHPLKVFLEWDIPFVLCTDNPSVHGASLSDEYKLFLEHFNRVDILEKMNERNNKYSFWRG
jgi:adenosine deaminase